MRTLVLSAAVVASLTWAGTAAAEPAAPGIAPLCAEFGGTVSAEQMCDVHVSNPQYMLDMTFPVDFPDSGALSDYLVQTRDGFVNVAEMPGSSNLPYALDVRSTRYSAGPPDGGTRSVVLEVYQNVGGAHPSTWFKTFNYDDAAEAPVTFDSLFAPGAEPLNAIYPAVTREVTRQLGEPSITPIGDGLDPAHYQNFVITDDAVLFFFGQGELWPEAAGAVQASVPRSAIPPLQI
jgi:hypothetical protein